MKMKILIVPCLAGLMVLAGCGKSVPDRMGVYSETYTDYAVKLGTANPPDPMGGWLGTWQSDEKNPASVTEDTRVFYEGQKSLKVTVGKGPWGGGMWIQFGFDTNEKPVKAVKDLSGYRDGCLVFWVKTTKNVLIKLESENGGTSEKNLSRYKIPLNDTWQKVVIPVRDFCESPQLDLKKINVVFGAHFILPYQNVVFWVDNIYLSRTKE